MTPQKQKPKPYLYDVPARQKEAAITRNAIPINPFYFRKGIRMKIRAGILSASDVGSILFSIVCRNDPQLVHDSRTKKLAEIKMQKALQEDTILALDTLESSLNRAQAYLKTNGLYYTDQKIYFAGVLKLIAQLRKAIKKGDTTRNTYNLFSQLETALKNLRDSVASLPASAGVKKRNAALSEELTVKFWSSFSMGMLFMANDSSPSATIISLPTLIESANFIQSSDRRIVWAIPLPSVPTPKRRKK